jgi:hypothetical protein
MAITPPRERTRKSRARRRRGVLPVQVEVSTTEIDFLNARGYGARREDPRAVGAAVSTFLADAVLDAST